MMLIVLFGLLCCYVVNFYRNVRRYPIGPAPLPLIGNLHQIDFKNVHIELAELSKKYGSIFTVWLPRPFVIIADCARIKEALSKDDFSGRTGVITDEIFYATENGGIVFSQGENWKEQRRFSLHVLRDFGMGKAIMEDMVTNSVEDCLDHLKSLDTAKGVDLRWPLQLFVGNIITRVLFNFSFKYDNCEQLKTFVRAGDEELQKIKDLHPMVMLLAQTWPCLCRIPFIKHFLLGSHYEVAERYYSVVRDFLKRSREEFNPNEEPACFSHAYSGEYFTEDQMLNVCGDFYGAGQETTTTTLRWAMLFLAQYQDVQEKMRAEIATVVGLSRLPSMNDKQRLPYVTASIHEIQRMANLLPLSLTHRTIKETTVGKIPIPKNTFVITLLSNVLLNSYKDGDVFKPERFLLEDGVTLNKEAVDNNIVFSTGKRVCAGEGLARVELFIGIVAILQNYKILPMPGKQVDLSPVISFALQPQRQLLRLVPLSELQSL